MSNLIKNTIRLALFVCAFAFAVSCSESMGATRGTGLLDSKPKEAQKHSSASSDEIAFDEEDSLDLDADSKDESVVSKASQDENSDGLRRADYEKREKADVESASLSEKSSDEGEFDQKGLASWYGREFHGRKTASGAKFDMYEITAAHKTLPFGTVLKVTNLDNGKSIKVTVNDRGPYKKTRILDLSYAAARELGYLAKGETMVGIDIVSMGDGKVNSSQQKEVKGVNGAEEILTDDTPSVQDDVRGNFEIQAGAFYSLKNAEKVKVRVESLTGGDVGIVEDGDLYKVRVRNIGSKGEAEKMIKSLEAEDIKTIIMQK